MPGKRTGPVKALFDWLRNPANAHWKLALYWPFYGAAYFLIGHLGGRTAPIGTAIPLDGKIPFVAPFIVPYLLWFPYWVGLLVYALIRELKLFKRAMAYFMLTFTTAAAIFWLFPTSPGLRPETFAREDIFTALTRFVYRADADRNALPSEHIIGVFAVLFGVWESEGLSRPLWKALAALMGLAIAASTVLVKQHAILDVVAAVPLSFLGYIICFWLPRRREGHQLGFDGETSIGYHPDKSPFAEQD